MLYRPMKAVSWVVVTVTLLLAGCITRRPATALDLRPAPKASFVIVDQRPVDERTTRWLSDVTSSCPVRQLGGEASDRFALLTESLNSALHERLSGKALLVTHFGVYINSAQRPSLHGDGLVQSLADYAEGTRLERLCVGHPAVTVQITFLLDGVSRSVRVFENTVPAAVKKASDQIVADLIAKPNVLTAEAR